MTDHLKPRLIIVAGPNGAGKSTFSKDFSIETAILYDPDKEAQRISEKYRGLPSESIYYHINHHFLDLAAAAWTQECNFILETNFRDYQLMETVELFRQKGYVVEMHYFLLRNLNASIDRVTTRVSRGGHYVDNASVQLNFEEGLKNLTYFCDRFDHIVLYDASGKQGSLKPVARFTGKERIDKKADTVKWASEIISSISLRLSR